MRRILSDAVLTSLSVGEFKSIGKEIRIDIAPLTILAGANSSGKSSVVQPLLLLKQTAEATYDPGPLLLDGPNVRFTRTEQMFHIGPRSTPLKEFVVGLGLGPSDPIEIRIHFSTSEKSLIDVKRLDVIRQSKSISLEPDGTYDLNELIDVHEPSSSLSHFALHKDAETALRVRVERVRFLFEAWVEISAAKIPIPRWELYGSLEWIVSELIHLPGHRGNPLRTYPRTGANGQFQGTFQNYVASVIESLENSGRRDVLVRICDDLQTLGLTWGITAAAVDDTQIELRVGRTTRHPRKAKQSDFVSIADVGFGVSQTLPVVVALQIATKGQTVYIEQPEIHLHPRAQHAMAELLADAANRGVRVICETHSSILLLGIQTLVAQGKLSPDKVKLHWFERGETDGVTHVTSADLDEAGRSGDWPADFDDVSLQANVDYLNSSRARQAGNGTSKHAKRKSRG